MNKKKKCRDSKHSLANLDVVLLLDTDGKPHEAWSLRLRLITLNETLIILDITNPNLIIIIIVLFIHWTKKKCRDSKHSLANLDVVLLLHRRQATQSLRTWHDYPWKSCTTVIHDMITPDLDMIIVYNLQVWCHKRWYLNLTVRFRPIRKEIATSMYNNTCCWSTFL